MYATMCFVVDAHSSYHMAQSSCFNHSQKAADLDKGGKLARKMLPMMLSATTLQASAETHPQDFYANGSIPVTSSKLPCKWWLNWHLGVSLRGILCKVVFKGTKGDPSIWQRGTRFPSEPNLSAEPQRLAPATAR